MKLPRIQQYFDRTLYAFLPDWGQDALIIKTLGLNYSIVYLGDEATALDTLDSRLKAGLPTLFYFWSPHSFHVQHMLNRISLPPYNPNSFKLGETDYPIDVLEKVASKKLVQLAPKVHQLLTRFTLSNLVQQEMTAAVAYQGLSAMESSCTWLQNAMNRETWQEWLPEGAAPQMSDASSLPCSNAELQSLIDAEDPLPVAQALLVTNPACAMCVIPCRSGVRQSQVDQGIRVFGISNLVCVFKCAHQNENVCNDVTGLSNILPFIDAAALHDRASLIRLLELVEAEY